MELKVLEKVYLKIIYIIVTNLVYKQDDNVIKMNSWDSLYHLYNQRDNNICILKERIVSVLFSELQNILFFLNEVKAYSIQQQSRVIAV